MYNNLKLFNELADKCGNRYLAARYLASVARNFGSDSQYKGLVLESKLLTWALTGEPPYTEKEIEKRRKFQVDSDIADLEDYLCYIDDEEVAQRVRMYYKKSLNSRHVVLDNSGTLDTYREMRVNIIVRMAWYGFQQ